MYNIYNENFVFENKCRTIKQRHKKISLTHIILLQDKEEKKEKRKKILILMKKSKFSKKDKSITWDKKHHKKNK